MEALDLQQILVRARAVVKNERSSESLETCLGAKAHRDVVMPRVIVESEGCFECGGPNHFARDCLVRRRGYKQD